jgi:hypothetical protein
MTFIVPGLIDPNWKGNALDASPGEDSNNQIILTDNKYDKSYISSTIKVIFQQ